MDSGTEATPLTEKQHGMIDVLAAKFARNARFRSVLDKDDYRQAAYVRVFEWLRERGRPLADVEVFIAARQAMSAERRSISMDLDRRPEIAEDPLRRKLDNSAATGDALDSLDALEVLDEEEARIALKRFWEGKSNRDISAETGSPHHRVERVGTRAVKKLRARLEASYAEEYARKHPKRYGNKIYGGHYTGRTPYAHSR